MSDDDDDYKTRYRSEFYEGGGGGVKKSFPCLHTSDDHKPKINLP